MLPHEIAAVAHEANRALQALQQDPGIPVAAPWDEFPDDERAGVIAGVEKALAGASPKELHQAWCEHKIAEGWVYGPIKNAEVKTHPCLVPYRQLSDEQKAKDALFASIVRALSSPTAAFPRVRVTGTPGRRNVAIDGFDVPKVQGVVTDEQANSYQLVTVTLTTDDLEVESPAQARARERALQL